jgi:sulfatase modifying factor 1
MGDCFFDGGARFMVVAIGAVFLFLLLNFHLIDIRLIAIKQKGREWMKNLIVIVWCLSVCLTNFSQVNGASTVPSNTITIKVLTPRGGPAATKSLTLYGTINGITEKYLLCQNKNIDWGSTNIFTIQRPLNIQTINYITLEATNTNDCWGPNCFIFELPDNKIWTFAGNMSIGSHKDKIIKYNTQPSITFYFTGPKSGIIKTANPYTKIVPEWAAQIKGKCVDTLSSTTIYDATQSSITSQPAQNSDSSDNSNVQNTTEPTITIPPDKTKTIPVTPIRKNTNVANKIIKAEENANNTTSDNNKPNFQDTIATPLSGQNWTLPDLGMQFVYVTPGGFWMGSDRTYGKGDERPRHRVTIQYDYWIGKHEVTQGEYESILGEKPSYFKNINSNQRPVENVTWYESVIFCQELTLRARGNGSLPSGYEYRLPTEAEWDFAARGGVMSKGSLYSGGAKHDDVAWHTDDSGSKTNDVGKKVANELGIYDMSGNVWEWCLDYYHGDYKDVPCDGSPMFKVAPSRVQRGGCYRTPDPQVTIRFNGFPYIKSDRGGFRVVLGRIIKFDQDTKDMLIKERKKKMLKQSYFE